MAGTKSQVVDSSFGPKNEEEARTLRRFANTKNKTGPRPRGVEDVAMDKFGKLKPGYGPPGLGSYEPPSTFVSVSPRHPEYQYRRGMMERGPVGTKSAFSFGLKANPKEFISAEHAKAMETYSPGPATIELEVLDKSFRYAKPMSPRIAFSQADRFRPAKKVYLGGLAAASMGGQEGPGPGGTVLPQGKGLAKTLGDAPTWKFGTGPQRVAAGGKESLRKPGPGAHNPAQKLSQHNPPSYTFGSKGANGGLRDRFGERHKEFMGSSFAKTEAPVETPGPGAYKRDDYPFDPDSADSKKKRYVTGEAHSYSFPHAERADPTMGSLGRWVNPGPEYLPAPSFRGTLTNGFTKSSVNTKEFAVDTRTFEKAKRFHDVELGGGKAGPIISSQHMAPQIGANSPGPATYGPFPYGSVPADKKVPSWKIGTGPQNDTYVDMSWVPGPGAHVVKKANEFTGGGYGGMQKAAPAYRIASCLRSDPTAGSNADVPGPGAYEVATAIGRPPSLSTVDPKSGKVIEGKIFGSDARKKNDPSYSFSKSSKSGFKAADMYYSGSAGIPAPGDHSHEHRGDFGQGRVIDDGKTVRWYGERPAFSIAGKEGPKGKTRMGLAGSGVSRYIGKMFTAECAGADSPGPGAYDLPSPWLDLGTVTQATANKNDAAKMRTLQKPFAVGVATHKIGTGPRGSDKLFVSKMHSQSTGGSRETPGPGAYSNVNGKVGNSGKYKASPSFGFGTSKRPPLNTVKF